MLLSEHDAALAQNSITAVKYTKVCLPIFEKINLLLSLFCLAH